MMLMTTFSRRSAKMMPNLVMLLVMLSMPMIELVAFVLETRIITGGNDNDDVGSEGDDDDNDDDEDGDDCVGRRWIE